MAPSSETKLQVCLRRFDIKYYRLVDSIDLSYRSSLYQPILELLKNGYGINTIDENGDNLMTKVVPLYYTQELNEMFKIIKLLISRGININHYVPQYGTIIDILNTQKENIPEDINYIDQLLTLIYEYI